MSVARAEDQLAKVLFVEVLMAIAADDSQEDDAFCTPSGASTPLEPAA